MKPRKQKTVGQASLEAKADTTRYDPLEIGDALTNDILIEVWKCIDAHHAKINEPEFCVVMLRASDPLIHGVMRRKFYAWPYLPKPRPEQIVFHYAKANDTIQRLWSLPSAKVMAVLSEMSHPAPQWKQTKSWCDAFFHGFRYDKKQNIWINKKPEAFYEFIRMTSNVDMPSESEFLNAHHAELLKASRNQIEGDLPDAFDFSKILKTKVVNSDKASA